MTRYAICAGLTRVNSSDYGGWDGECPGCDRDAASVAKMLHDKGFDGIEVLINSAVTHDGVRESFLRASRILSADDLLVLYFSGHGGQIPDLDGDEDDDLDETICLYDGEADDDVIASYLKKLAKGVRVWFATDSCNSGTNYRGMRRRKRSTPVRIHSKPDGFRGSLLHFGGCADGRSSYGDDDGGAFTLAMLDAIAKARRPLNYTDLFQRTCERMPSYQRPVIASYGAPSFTHLEAGT